MRFRVWSKQPPTAQTARQLALALFLVALACSPTPRPSLPIETDVCALVADPKTFGQRRVILNTSISADGKHLALLMGSTCDHDARYTPFRSDPFFRS